MIIQTTAKNSASLVACGSFITNPPRDMKGDLKVGSPIPLNILKPNILKFGQNVIESTYEVYSLVTLSPIGTLPTENVCYVYYNSRAQS